MGGRQLGGVVVVAACLPLLMGKGQCRSGGATTPQIVSETVTRDVVLDASAPVTTLTLTATANDAAFPQSGGAELSGIFVVTVRLTSGPGTVTRTMTGPYPCFSEECGAPAIVIASDDQITRPWFQETLGDTCTERPGCTQSAALTLELTGDEGSAAVYVEAYALIHGVGDHSGAAVSLTVTP